MRAFPALAMTAMIVACGGPAGFGAPPYARSDAGAVFNPATTKSPIKHVVILIQENRSFDNFFATFPGADGTTTGKAAAMSGSEASYCSDEGMPVITKPTSIPLQETDLYGSGFGKSGHFAENTDAPHIHSGFKTEYDQRKMDGFDLVGNNPNGSGSPLCTYVYQYVNPNDIAPYWDIATQYVLADHTFQTQASGSFTGHQDLIAAGTQIKTNEALIDNPTYFPWGCDANPPVRTAIIKRSGEVDRYGGPFPCLKYSTLRDLLDAKSVSWKFYAMPVQKESGPNHGDTAGIWSAFDAIKAVRYSDEWRQNVTRGSSVILKDISNRRLPAVAWVTPDAVNSDHPAEKSDTGPSWVASIVNAIGESGYWKSTAVVVVWDDWGGFYDHVPPPRPFNWQGGPGFRVPMLIVSPYVKAHVEHTVYQFGSVLRFIENNWGLGTLGRNDAHSTSIGTAFDFNMKPRTFHKIPSKYPVDYFLHQQPSGLVPDTE